MSFRKPVSTLGGKTFWRLLKQSELFLMQEHVFPSIWFYRYRILMRTTGWEIANARDLDEIEGDWSYLTTNAIPQLEHAVDIAKAMRDAGEAVGDALKKVKDVVLDPKIVAVLLPIVVGYLVGRKPKSL